MSRPVPALAALATLAVLVAACSESSTGPEHAISRGPSLPTMAAPVRLTEAQLESSNSSYRFSFIVSPNGTSYTDGVNTITFPAGAVCGSGSGYGPEHWNAPCTAVTEDILFTVTLSQVNGVRSVHFSPDVRFVPGKEVVLSMSAESLPDSGVTPPTIFWSPDSTQLVDEGAVDSSLETWLDSATGKLMRRIKHFSGYTVDIGFKDPCDQDPSSPECTSGN